MFSHIKNSINDSRDRHIHILHYIKQAPTLRLNRTLLKKNTASNPRNGQIGSDES